MKGLINQVKSKTLSFLKRLNKKRYNQLNLYYLS